MLVLANEQYMRIAVDNSADMLFNLEHFADTATSIQHPVDTSNWRTSSGLSLTNSDRLLAYTRAT